MYFLLCSNVNDFEVCGFMENTKTFKGETVISDVVVQWVSLLHRFIQQNLNSGSAGFSLLREWGEVPPTSQKFAHLPHLGKFSPSRLPSTKFLSPPPKVDPAE